jgi:NTE family protein
VLTAPDLGDISATKFDRSKDAIRIGENATRALADSLKRYSLPPEQYAAFRSKQIADVKPPAPVESIAFAGLKRTNPEVLRALVETKPGEPLDMAKLGDDMRRIYGRQDFEGIGYTIGGGQTGPRALTIVPREKSWGPDYLRFGLGLASDFHGDNQFNFLAEYRKTWMNKLGGEWLSQAQIGQNTYVSTEFYQPITESGRWFVAPYGSAGRQTRGVFIGEDKVADYLIGTFQGGVDAGAAMGTWGQLRIGPVWTHVNARVDTGSPVLPSVRETTAGVRANLFVDQADHAWFPTDGFFGTATGYAALTSFGSAQSYQKLQGAMRYAKSWGPNTIQLYAEGGTDFNSSMPAYESFTLGGPLRLSGYRVNEFAGRNYAFGRAMYYNRIFPLPDLIGSGVYVGGSAEVGRMSDRFDGLPSQGTLWSGSVFAGADTFLGPAFIGFGVAPAGRYSLYMLLGAP